MFVFKRLGVLASRLPQLAVGLGGTVCLFKAEYLIRIINIVAGPVLSDVGPLAIEDLDLVGTCPLCLNVEDNLFSGENRRLNLLMLERVDADRLIGGLESIDILALRDS